MIKHNVFITTYICGGFSAEEAYSRFGMRPNREFKLYKKEEGIDDQASKRRAAT